MRTLMRVVPFLLALIIIFGGIFLIYNFFSSKNNANVKILTISKDGKFSASNLKIANSDKFKIKNNDDVNQTVKIVGTNQSLVELDSGATSNDLTLKSNSTNNLYLASDPNQKSVITVGEPQTTSKTTTDTATKETAGVVKTAVTSNKPLPNTGPGDSYLLSLLGIVGFLLIKASNLFWKTFVR